MECFLGRALDGAKSLTNYRYIRIITSKIVEASAGGRFKRAMPN